MAVILGYTTVLIAKIPPPLDPEYSQRAASQRSGNWQAIEIMPIRERYQANRIQIHYRPVKVVTKNAPIPAPVDIS